MSTVSTLENIKSFLEEKVAPRIELQQPNDNNVQEYSLAHPNVFIGWLPPKGYLPDGMETSIPCLVVGMDDASDNAEEESYNIRISAAVYSPGLHKSPGIYTPDFQGYIDLLNFIDRTKAELLKNRVASHPVKWGMYEQQPYPYWYGWITFLVGKQSYPPSEIVRKYL